MLSKNIFQKLKVSLITLALILIFFPGFVFGAKLYLDPSEGEFRPGDTFLVEIKIDNEKECVNVVQAQLSFSKDILEAVDFSRGETILSLWLEPPIIDQTAGLISFIGGLPGGYCGRIAGDPGPSNLIGKIVFRVPGTSVSQNKEATAEINFLEKSQVLLSDRQGTKAVLSVQGARFKILSQPGITQDQWIELIKKDHVAPEQFKIEVVKDPTVLAGKYFIVFSTNDKETGIDYYEVKEGESPWQKAVSPYVLEDQSLKNIIKVRAVDKAGNETISELLPVQKPTFPYYLIILAVILIILLLLLILAAVKVACKRNGRQEK